MLRKAILSTLTQNENLDENFFIKTSLRSRINKARLLFLCPDHVTVRSRNSPANVHTLSIYPLKIE